jgi:dihydropteroate synthase
VVAVKLMGVVNVTPDSFSDGGLFLEPEAAVDHGRELAAAGADVVDVGGESTRPGADAVSEELELERTTPVVAGLSRAGIAVSIDTSKAAVAEAALDAGASMVNDVTALRAEPGLAAMCAARDCELVLMHMQGTPRTMQENPTYDDVVDDVKAFLEERIEFAVEAGVAEARIWIDPGIGFGKTVSHNLELLRRLDELRELGRPILVGTSRKSFVGRITGRDVARRGGGPLAAKVVALPRGLGGTIASNVLALAGGADMLRVHDVTELVQAMHVAEVILGRTGWTARQSRT